MSADHISKFFAQVERNHYIDIEGVFAKELALLISMGQMICAIKKMRAAADPFGLKEAKDFVEAYRDELELNGFKHVFMAHCDPRALNDIFAPLFSVHQRGKSAILEDRLKRATRKIEELEARIARLQNNQS